MMTRKLSNLLLGGAVAAAALFSSEADAFRLVFPYKHPDLEWYTIETEHFEVHYPVSKKTREEGNDHYLTAEWSARKYAKVAEESWQPMCAQFNYFLKEKIHIVVLNQGDELEGFTIPNWDWIVMSSNPGGSFYRGRGRMEWFSDVFVHEFAHVVSLKANGSHSEGTYAATLGSLYENGVNRGRLNQTSTGIEVPIGDADSVFWTEGGAEYWSDNANYNWWTAARDQNIRMTTLQGRLLEYDEWHTRANKSESGWNDHERYYQQGYSFGLYLRERFGDDTYARFAQEYGKRWRPQWETVIEDVLGVDAETLYWDWREYVTERYTSQYERIKEQGEVSGHEMLSGPREWDYHDPEKRDAYFRQEREGWFGHKQDDELENDRDRTGTWQFEPRVSEDGKYIGWVNRGQLAVSRTSEDAVWAFTGARLSDPVEAERNAEMSFRVPFTAFDHGWSFVPGQEAVVVTASEDSHPRGTFSTLTGIRFEEDGYNWNRLFYYEYPTVVEEKRGNRTVKTRNPTKGFMHNRKWRGEWYEIPNTERGSDPSVSPDGKRVAYFEYTDGTMNLITINIDGTDKKRITTFDDGTWFQVADWSPDGTKLVFTIFRNYQQNLYIANADGSDMKPIMVDEWEEMDAHWSAVDNKIYFSADPDGVFNIYSYDPKTEEFLKITNVVGGASSPQLTPEGNLVYSYYTSFGWKIYGLAKDEFLNLSANHLFNTEIDQQAVEEELAHREDMSVYDSMTTPYRPTKAISAPIFLPLYRLQNDTLTNWGMQGGFVAQLMDYVQYHQTVAVILLGEELLLQGAYTYDGWYPSFSLYGLHFQGRNDQGFLLDADDDPTTTSDQEVYEVRRNFAYTILGGSVGYQWNGNFSTFFNTSGLLFGLRNVDSAQFEPFQMWATAGVDALWSNNSWLARSPNPYYGRTVSFSYNHGWTDILFEDQGGVAVDDGELLDNYQFNQFEFRWTEQIPIRAWGNVPFLKYFASRRHTFQLDSHLGFVDRNVNLNNEFNAGGRHPYNWGYGSLQSNTQFAGYPAWSLSGETMVIFNGAYRFPVVRPEWSKRAGPLFISDMAVQVGGTVGNLWSYRPPSDPSLYYSSRFGERIAYDQADIKREIPFVDEAYKNGNRVLTDLSAELRMSTVLYHGMPWDSFLRLAYGFNEIRGFGDVDGNDIFDTNDSAVGDELSNETEPAGLRVYVGFGTGW